MSPPGLLLLTWCEPWLIGLPVSAVRNIQPVDAPTPPGALRLSTLLGLTPTGPSSTPGAWVLIDRFPALTLGVDRCLQVVDPGPLLLPVPPALRTGPVPLSCFPVLRPITGLDRHPPVGLWLDPTVLPDSWVSP